MFESKERAAHPDLLSFLTTENMTDAMMRASEIALRLRTSPPSMHLNLTHGFLLLLEYFPKDFDAPLNCHRVVPKFYNLRSIQVVTWEEGKALLDSTGNAWHGQRLPTPGDRKVVSFYCLIQDFRTKESYAEYYEFSMIIPSDQYYKGRDARYWETDFHHAMNQPSDSDSNIYLCECIKSMQYYVGNTSEPIISAAPAALHIYDPSPELYNMYKTHAILIFLKYLPDKRRWAATSITTILHEEALELLSTIPVNATVNFLRDGYYENLSSKWHEWKDFKDFVPFKTVVVEEGDHFVHAISFTRIVKNVSKSRGKVERDTEWESKFFKEFNGDLVTEHDPDFLKSAKQRAVTPIRACFYCFEKLSTSEQKKCGVCQTIHCSSECQKLDWKRGHKGACEKVAKSRKIANKKR